MKAIAAILLFTVTTSVAQNIVPVLKDSKIKAEAKVNPAAYAFAPGQVRLLDGPFKKAMELDAAYLLEIEPNRLLHRFHKFAGLSTKGEMYGGWEKETLSGHTLGHYLSACAIHYASVGDTRFKERVDYIVGELAACQQARKTGYVGAIPKEDSVFRLVKEGKMHVLPFSLNGAWSPWYTEHKVLAGLLDAYYFANNEKALAIAEWFAVWVDAMLKDLNPEQIQKMLDCEFGGMNEALVNLYALTGKRQYLELSYKFEHKRITDPLGRNEDDLYDKHSNTQIPKIIGSARRYMFTTENRDKTVSEFFWNTIANNHTYVIGGNSDSEYLGKAGKLNERLSDNTAETCNTYNMLKLTRNLFTREPSAKLADYYERALYNHIYSSQRSTDGMMCYFTPMRKGAKKDYSDKFNSFWCCVGSGMENHVKYNEGIYYQGPNSELFVNLFVSSQLKFNSFTNITQTTQYPEESSTELKFDVTKSTTFPVYIRKPWWARGETRMTLNGVPIKSELDSKTGYYKILNKWKKGDLLKIEFPMSLYTESMPDNPNRVAFMYGPLVLASPMGEEEPKGLTGTPILLTEKRDVSTFTKKSSGLSFETSGAGFPSDIKLIPFNTIHEGRYNIYWDFFTPAEWERAQNDYDETERKAKRLEELTIDFLQPGDSISEKTHSLTHAKSYRGLDNGKRWRDAREEGHITFNMKVSSDVKQSLQLSFWGSDGGGRIIFDVLVNGTKIATQEVRQNFPNRFFDVNYPLDAALFRGKNTIEVSLRPQYDKRVARVFGVRVFKDIAN
jgi:DUF1680 family protein